MPVRVLIVDDHSVVRQGLRMFLKLDAELEVVGEAANGAEAIQMARALTPDVVLMDLLMPGTDGIAATQRIRAEVPNTEVLALTSRGTPGLTDPDDVPEPPVVPVSKTSDVWLLGRHRVLCGDSTAAVTWRRCSAPFNRI